MTSRYDGRKIRTNTSGEYKEIFKERNVKYIMQYLTANMTYPSTEQIMQLSNYSHVWKLGDRFYKLADQYYQDPSLWWIIAWYNKRPTESHVQIGQILRIPLPLDKILQILDV